MKNIAFILLSLAIYPINSLCAIGTEDVLGKLDERITDIELSSLKNKINFGIDFKVETAIMNDRSKIGSAAETSKHGHISSYLFRLNTNFEVSEDLSFFASAETLDFYNSSLFYNKQSSPSQEEQNKGSTLNMSKAYFDWRIFSNWLTFSAGRLPTTQGPPAHSKDGSAREGTYPVTGYSLPLDGFALTTKLSALLEMKDNLAFRLITTPGGPANGRYPFKGVSLNDPSNINKYTVNNKGFTGMLEYEHDDDNSNFVKNILVIFQTGYYKFGSAPSYGTAYQLYTGAGSSSDDLYRLFASNSDLIRARVFSPYLEFKKIANTQLDFYTTFSFTNSESLTNIKAVKLSGTGAAFPSGTVIDLGPFMVQGKRSGTRTLVGLRYALPANYTIGVEYMGTSGASLPTVFYSNSLINSNFYNGSSREFYAYKSMYNGNFIARLGFTHLKIDQDLSKGLSLLDTDETTKIGLLSFAIKI
jgi:hypothetical protein